MLWKSGFMENCVVLLGTSNLTYSQHLQYDLFAVTICLLSPTHSPFHPKTNWTSKTSALFQPITGVVCLHQIHTASLHSMTMTVCLSGHQRGRPSSCDRCVAVVSAPELCVLRWAGQCSVTGRLDDREIRFNSYVGGDSVCRCFRTMRRNVRLMLVPRCGFQVYYLVVYLCLFCIK